MINFGYHLKLKYDVYDILWNFQINFNLFLIFHDKKKQIWSLWPYPLTHTKQLRRDYTKIIENSRIEKWINYIRFWKLALFIDARDYYKSYMNCGITLLYNNNMAKALTLHNCKNNKSNFSKMPVNSNKNYDVIRDVTDKGLPQYNVAAMY